MNPHRFLLLMLLSIFTTAHGPVMDWDAFAEDPAAVISGHLPETDEPPEANPSRQVLSLGLGMTLTAKDALDPHRAGESRKRVIAEMIFNRLIRYKPGSATQFEPDLAETIPEPETAAGRQIWKFRLRKDVMFHTGPDTAAHEMTATDVVYSLEKAAKTAPKYVGDYTGMTAEKIDPDDPYSVKIILENPMTPLIFKTRLAAYAGGFIISRRAHEAMGRERFKTQPVGTGPFVVQAYLPAEKIVLKAHDRYFRGPPSLEGVDIRFLPDIAEREAGLKSGELDIIEGEPDTAWIEKMEQEPDITVETDGIGEVAMIHFNMGKPPLNDIRIRRAMAYALDRDAFQKPFGDRVAENVYAPVPAFLSGLKRDRIERFGLDYPTNLEKARELLEKAGCPEGFPLEMVTSERPIYRGYYERMKSQLAQIGIDCKLKVVDHPGMHIRIRWDENPLVVYISWRPDADAALSRFFHSEAIVNTGERPDVNFSHYDKADRLIETARTETDPKKQRRLWEYAEIKILDHMAAYPLQYIRPVHARRICVDYGHQTETPALCPHITEKTRIVREQAK